jgi:competence protein ComEC
VLLSILSLVAGIIAVQQFSALPENVWVVFLAVAIFLLAFFRFWRLMFFTIGLVWAIVFASIRLADRLPDQLEGMHLQVEGQVIGLPQYDDRRVRFDFAVSKSNYQMPDKIRLSWFSPKQQINTGQYWQMTVKLKQPHGRFNPGGFDYERWLFMQNIGATGYVRNNPEPVLLSTPPIWQNFSAIRQTIADRLTGLLEHSDNIGLIKALTIGERNEISSEQWDIFRKTGTIHLLAISGLHIGLISGLIYFLAIKISVKLSVTSPQKIAAISAIAVAIFYSALAGFSVPTQRSLIMLTIVMFAIAWQRNSSAKNTLALAMLAVVMIDPLAVLSAGFWLSFLAVTIIVYSLAGRLGKAGYWVGALKIHCVTAIGLSPILIFYFQQVSIIAPLANFIAVPVVSLLIVPLCFIAVLSMPVSAEMAIIIFQLIDEILQVLWLLLSAMAGFPYASATTALPPFYGIPFALLGVFVLLSPRGMPARWLGWILLLPLLFVKQDKPKVGDVEMTLLDVGQGLSAVIQTANHTLVFDTGAKYSEQFDMGDSVVMPYLQYKGIQQIDTLLISHADNDHIGGAKSIIEQIKVKKILTSVPKSLDKYQPIQCKAGQQWVWDQVVFKIISPTLGVLNGENNNSCVLKVSTKKSSILLTGDIEKEAESRLVGQQGIKLKSDVLIAPHHGSKTSSSMPFLKQVLPSKVLIPAGYKNRFSFPHDSVVERYEALNASWMNTADKGAITVKLKENHFTVSAVRTDEKRYWH